MINLVFLLWLAWLAWWMVLARDVKADRWREPWGSRLTHGVPLLLAALLLFGPSRAQGGPAAVGITLLVAGLGFAVWARAVIGRNWSSTVTLKDGHTLVSSGPYRFVRHPIYSGLILAILGTALINGRWRALAAVLLATGAFLYKSRVEERRLEQVFPEYDAYRRHTPALVPFLL